MAALLVWRRTAGPRRPLAASVALVALVGLQQALGEARVLAAHLPLGMAIFGNTIDMAPGERFDVIVDFADHPVGSRITLRNTAASGAMRDVMRLKRSYGPPGTPHMCRTGFRPPSRS
ncbi:hypothetical protein ABZ924_11155 [Streptomyces sp. NPDC046876]|uniref:hypothetical protein n=1 Tax=Streptomyces sp. NPDC046876 TaxID=3155616 RepID=UPI0033E17D2E